MDNRWLVIGVLFGVVGTSACGAAEDAAEGEPEISSAPIVNGDAITETTPFVNVSGSDYASSQRRRRSPQFAPKQAP